MSNKNKRPLIGVIVGLDREKKLITQQSNLIIESGYGKKAIQATKKLIKRKVDVVLSLGFAGSIDTNLKNSEVIIPKIIFNKRSKGSQTSKKFNFYFKKILNDFSFFECNLITSSNIENLSEYRNEMFIKSKHISAVDMESSHIQEVAIRNRVDFCAIRVIFDDLNFSIPKFITDIIDENGEIIQRKLLIALLKKPTRIIYLTRLMKYYLKSKKKLKEIGFKLSK